MSTHISSRGHKRPRIVIPASEHARLMALAHAAEKGSPAVAEFLADELSRAQIVGDEQCDPHVVRMGSRVTYRDEVTGRTRTVTLVYPNAADIDRNLISILTPIGAALIGLSPSQSISWPNPDGRVGSLTVLNVTNEEESQGDGVTG
jgi:regulator of nucleoside diphosphate kinase